MPDPEERGLAPIGARLPPMPNSPSASDCPLNPSQTGSAITGLHSQAKKGSSSTGQQRGATGAGRPPMMPVASAKHLRTPMAEVERHLEASLPPSVTCLLESTTVDRTTREFGWDVEFDGYRLRRGAALCQDDVDAVERSIMLHARSCAPAPEDVLMKELAALRVLTKARASDDSDLKFTISVYARKLAEWPADIALHVLRTHPEASRWWPAWEELATRLHSMTKRRRTRLQALMRLESEYRSGREKNNRDGHGEN